MKVLELGAGMSPREGALNHDRVLHSPHIDIAWDLEQTPWPWKHDCFDEVYAYDVFEHLKMEIVDWLKELHRVLVVAGKAHLRLPAWDNPLSYRDPTHRKVFHPETLDYFDPEKDLYKQFGRYYWDDVPQFKVTFMGKENNDLLFDLEKI